MTRRRLLCVGGLIPGLAVGVCLLFPGVRWALWGLWRGEAFYRGWPASSWRQRVEAYLVEHRARGEVPATPLDSVKQVSGLGKPNYRHPDPFHEADAAAVPVLIDLLRDARPPMRRYAAGKLGAIGPPARAAVPALVEVVRDEEADRDADGFGWSVRPTAAWALGRIDPGAAARAGVPR